VRDEIDKFERAGVQPFGVNPAAVDSHQKYVEKMRFNFPLLADPDRAIARAFHALKEDERGIIRTVYLITQDGSIAFAERGMPAVADVVAAVGPRD
jgi:peroxiredoxin Q/BCP